MSRPKGIENLLAGAPADIAPAVTDVKKQAEAKPEAKPAARRKPRQKEAVTATERKPQKPDIGRASDKSPSPIRFQVSAPEGSHVEQALQDLLAEVPEALRAGLNIGTLFRQIIIDHDAEIAAMIRESVGKR